MTSCKLENTGSSSCAPVSGCRMEVIYSNVCLLCGKPTWARTECVLAQCCADPSRAGSSTFPGNNACKPVVPSLEVLEELIQPEGSQDSLQDEKSKNKTTCTRHKKAVIKTTESPPRWFKVWASLRTSQDWVQTLGTGLSPYLDKFEWGRSPNMVKFWVKTRSICGHVKSQDRVHT